MTVLSWMTMGFALFYAVCGAMMIMKPQACQLGLERFPRSVWAGRLLLSVDFLWIILMMHQSSFGEFGWIKEIYYRWVPGLETANLGLFTFIKDPTVAGGVIVYLVILFYMNDLLAPRALGGLLLLLASPILTSARWMETSWRLVMVVIAYVMVVKGIMLVLSPFRFRQWCVWAMKRDEMMGLWGGICFCISVFLLVLACTAYRG